MPRTGTSPQVAARRDVIYDTVAATPKPVSVRNIFYQLVGSGSVPKEEKWYKKIDADLTAMRREGRVPYDWITDGSRNAIGKTSETHLTAAEAVSRFLDAARPITSIWKPMGIRPQLWVESRSAAGMIADVAAEYEISVWPTAGHPSVTLLYEASLLKPTHIGIMTDYDKQGLDIRRNIQKDLDGFGGGPHGRDAPWGYELIAVTLAQAEHFGLPEQVGKPGYQIEALPVQALRNMVAEWAEELLPPGRKEEYDNEVSDIKKEISEIVADIKSVFDERNEDNE